MGQSVTAGVIVERVGDDLMVIVPGASEVLSLSGHSVDVLLDVKAGRTVDSADPALRDLVDLGVVSAPGLSRRGLIKAGAIGSAAGIAVLAMPGVAAASSTLQLQGIWSYLDFSDAGWRQYFLIESDQFPDDDSEPTVLTLGSVTVGVGGFEGGVVAWLREVDNPGVGFDTSDIFGTFEWGVPFSVRFEYSALDPG